MFMMHTTGCCKGCGLKIEQKDECTCEWAICPVCQVHDCYIHNTEIRAFNCYNCDYSNARSNND